ncbi:GntR family transcriptional regulator [Rahnella sp. FRB 231]|uniref:GntR family transcriptional regulator n=2 Tax=Rahnella ecdela TaxID=2816250 RepID=A0ABS6L9K1_9GAMM|nr:GntR family transcriptional regulator [Rahnella ecdela]MBU9843610.1 GntR family transcriptional regulator [Rahnella ecdela]
MNELAYRRFKQALVTLSYKPGDYLNTAQVMAELQMGRTPVNQAIHRLENEGLLQIIPRKGVMVSPLSLDDALELIEVRLANEILSVKLACKRISKQDIVALTAVNEEMNIAVQERNRNRMVSLDLHFHQLIVEISGNLILKDILSVLHTRSQRFWASSLSKEGHRMEVIEEHRAIITALESEDSQAAATAAETHILSFRDALLRG